MVSYVCTRFLWITDVKINSHKIKAIYKKYLFTVFTRVGSTVCKIQVHRRVLNIDILLWRVGWLWQFVQFVCMYTGVHLELCITDASEWIQNEMSPGVREDPGLHGWVWLQPDPGPGVWAYHCTPQESSCPPPGSGWALGLGGYILQYRVVYIMLGCREACIPCKSVTGKNDIPGINSQ